MSRESGVNRMQLILDPWAEAGKQLESARRDHPGFADVRYLYGLLLLARDDLARAEGEFAAALEVNPEYRRARFAWLLTRRLREGSLDPADWSRFDPTRGEEEPDRSLWTAWYLAQADDREGARRVLDLLAEKGPWSGVAAYVRAVYERSWNSPEGARTALRASAAAHPVYGEVLDRRGWVPAGAPRRAAAEFDPAHALGDGAAVSWNPLASDLCQHLGGVCARHGAIDDARLFYDEAFLRHGRETLLQISLSQLALLHGDEEEAVRSLCRAIEVDPTSVPARIALGFEYQSQGYQEEALVQFEVAARLQPDWPDVQYNLGLLYEEQGRSEDAVRCLRRALDTNRGYFQARMSLSQLLLAQEAFGEALAELTELTHQGVSSADLHVQKAQCLLALEREADAVAELEEAVALNPSYARSYYILGQAYRRMGLRRKARHAWQQYLEKSRSWRDLQPAGLGEDVRS